MKTNEQIYIIIHGFAGGIFEIEPLCDFLRAKKLTVHSILLAGHGGTKKDLSASSYKDWIKSAIKQVTDIKNKYDKDVEINLVGFSMGGLICVHLTDFFDVKKIVFVNTPIYYWNIEQIVKNIVIDVKHIKFYADSAGNSSAKALINFTRILHTTKTKFSSVCVKRANPLIIQCIDDDTVQSKSADFMKKEIGNSAKVIYYATGGHLVFLSATRHQACYDIYAYLCL